MEDAISLVKDELFTLEEMHEYKIPSKCVQKIEIENPEDTYWFFGARFKAEEN
jgi:hypothetical protein